MDPRRRKATRSASTVGAAAPEVLAHAVKGPRAELSEPSAAPRAARPPTQKCGPAGAAGSRRKKSALGSPERRQVRAPPAADEVEGQRVSAAKQEPPAAPRPPLARTRSRREGGERSSREPRAVSELAGGLGLGPLLPASSFRQERPAPGAWKPRLVLEKLRLRRQEISEAAEVVNRVVDYLSRRLQSYESEFRGVSLLRTGSYYEHVKISAPNEFDIMFKLEVPRIQLEEYCKTGAYYFVKFKRNPKGNPLSQFLEDEKLSASKMLSKFRKIIKEEIKNIQATDIIMEKKKRGSPAITLLIRKPKEISVDIILALESKSSWPASTQEGLPISHWLGTKVKTNLRRQPFYLVPKHAKEGNYFQEETWRLSFSHIEKDLLKSHGQSKTCCESDGVKCCRKDCLKLMKYLLEQLKTKFGNRKRNWINSALTINTFICIPEKTIHAYGTTLKETGMASPRLLCAHPAFSLGAAAVR
ncbi:cyclic GMP-AMP synthase isoform X6 [Canis lupus familiaris]|uniref:Cyclic GMP-AMP synthase n=1 Tax=Canis lupus familiaris TaxID=9615 RepID=A0A8I3NL22_CANLF|nr:cyclic GMP-AMP synthase isoform X6 [Canis lupus familiaris]